MKALNDITAGEISRRLNDRADAVCHLLLPGGRIVKNEYLCGSIDGGEGDSLKVHLQGSYVGNWRDWAGSDSEKGDLIDLWRLARNLSRGEAFKQCKEYLGILENIGQPIQKAYAKPPQKATQTPTPQTKSYNFFKTDRLIKDETIALFQVQIQTEGGNAIIFPCISPTGELVNRSYRTLPRDKTEKKKVWQDENCAPSLFGWQALPEAAYRCRMVLICEGQIDAMTWHQWGIPALSIPNGSGQTWINYEWDNLAIFDKILIAFDGDEAGQKNAASVQQRLGSHRCHIVTLAYGKAKDANAALQAGATEENAWQWVESARPPQLNGLITGSDLMQRMMAELAPKPMPFTLPWMNVNWHHGKGFFFRPGEITVWVGSTGNGKSTFLNFLSMNLIESGRPVFIASMELRPETTLRKTAQASFGAAGQNVYGIAPSHYQSWLMEHGDNISFADRVGFITQDELLEMMFFAFKRYGASHFFIDSLMRIEGLEENAPAMGTFMNRLQDFCKPTGAHVHLVAHGKKIAPGKKPGVDDIKGSSLIANNADNVLAIQRNADKWEKQKTGTLTEQDADKIHDAEIIVEKQRETGWTGTFFLSFDAGRLTYSPLTKE